MNFMQEQIIVKNSSNKPSLTFIMSLIMREGSKGEMDFCYGYFVTNKSYNDWKKNFYRIWFRKHIVKNSSNDF